MRRVCEKAGAKLVKEGEGWRWHHQFKTDHKYGEIFKTEEEALVHLWALQEVRYWRDLHPKQVAELAGKPHWM